MSSPSPTRTWPNYVILEINWLKDMKNITRNVEHLKEHHHNDQKVYLDASKHNKGVEISMFQSKYKNIA